MNQEEIKQLLLTIKNSGDNQVPVPEFLLQNYDFALQMVSINWNYLELLSDKFKNDFDIVMSAVKNYGMALYYASDNLKNN